MIAENQDVPRFRIIDGQIYVSYDLYMSVSDSLTKNSQQLANLTIKYTELVCENTNRLIRKDYYKKPVFTIKLATEKDK